MSLWVGFLGCGVGSRNRAFPSCTGTWRCSGGSGRSSLSCLPSPCSAVSLGYTRSGWGRSGSSGKSGLGEGWGAGLREVLASGVPSPSPLSQQFSPVSAMEPLGLQVLGNERQDREEGPQGPPLWLVLGGGLWKGCSPSTSLYSSSISWRAGQAQTAPHPPQAGQQVQQVGLGKSGRDPREEGRSEGQGNGEGRVAVRLRPEGRGWEGP